MIIKIFVEIIDPPTQKRQTIKNAHCSKGCNCNKSMDDSQCHFNGVMFSLYPATAMSQNISSNFSRSF